MRLLARQALVIDRQQEALAAKDKTIAELKAALPESGMPQT